MPIAALASALPGAATAPDWVRLLPAGVFSGRDGRGPYSLQDVDALIRSTIEHHGSIDLVVDYDHQTDRAPRLGNQAPAAGWIKELQARADGLWGRIEWTAAAATLIAERAYRFISPVFLHPKVPEGGAYPARLLLRAGLTNTPNLALGALHSHDTEDDMTSITNAVVAHAAAVGLAADDDPAAIIAAMAAQAAGFRALATAAGLTAAANPDEVRAKLATPVDAAKWAPIETVTALQTQIAAVTRAQAEAAAASFADRVIAAGKMPPVQRDWLVSYHQADPRAAEAWEAKQPVLVAPGQRQTPVSAPPGGALTAEDMQIAALMGLDHEAFRKARDAEVAGSVAR